MDAKNTDNNVMLHRVVLLRRKLSLNQNEFAESIVYSVDIIRKIEQGKRELSLNIALAIAKKYSVSLDWLYGISDEINDEVGSIITSLKKIFNINSYIENYIEMGMTEPVTQLYLSLKMESTLKELLFELEKAEKFKCENNLPIEAYEAWISAIKEKYKNIPKSDDKSELEEYICIPKSVFTNKFVYNSIKEAIFNAERN